ncbi:MAG: AAA family ATPase [Terriglobales bacterium]
MTRLLGQRDSEARAYFENYFGLASGGRAQRTVRCPVHKDGRPSLSVNLDSGLWNCKAGCGSGNLAQFRKLVNGNGAAFVPAMRQATRFGVPQPSAPEVEYLYCDSTGRELLFKKVRMPGKQFHLERFDNGQWVTGLLQGGPRPLYRLPDVIAAKNVALCEGEKDANRLNRVFAELGMTDWAATTNFDGAAGPWRDEYALPLQDKHVVLVGDNDPPGRDHVALYARAIDRVAASVAVAEMAGLAEHGDVSDYLDEHGDAALLPLLEQAPSFADPDLSRFETLEEFLANSPEDVDWLVKDLIVAGGCTEVRGVAKVGKSTYVNVMVESVLEGKPFLGRKTIKVPVLYMTEMNKHELRFQLAQAGLGKPRRDLLLLRLHKALDLTWARIAELARTMCRKTGARLLIVDTFTVWSRNEDENSSSKTNAAYFPLKSVESDGVAVLLETHARKAGGPIAESGRGSNALAGTASVIITLETLSKSSPQTQRKMEVAGRFGSCTEIIDRMAAGYTVAGDKRSVARDTTERNVLAALPRVETEAETVPQLVRRKVGRKTLIQRVLKEAAERNIIKCKLDHPDKQPSAKNPLRYWCDVPLKEPNF